MPRKNFRTVVVLTSLLLASIVLAACGSPDPWAATNVCTLVRTTDAEIVMDGPISQRTTETGDGTSACFYENGSNDLLQIYVTLFDTQDDVDAVFVQNYRSANYTYVDGVGDAAYRSTPMYPENLVQNGDLGVLYGKYLIVIDITDELQVEDVIELAKILVSRLP